MSLLSKLHAIVLRTAHKSKARVMSPLSTVDPLFIIHRGDTLRIYSTFTRRTPYAAAPMELPLKM